MTILAAAADVFSWMTLMGILPTEANSSATATTYADDTIELGNKLLKPINITVFSEKFADECAGGFIEISIETENDNSDCTSLANNSVVAIETEDNNLINSQDNLTLIQE